MRNIVLVGFMGTGKTAVAAALSTKLKMKYVSTDQLIEDKEKLCISEIFAEKGEGYFRKIEKAAVKDASRMENVVIDAGGGVVIDPENMENLKKNGKVFCLWAEPKIILGRTKKHDTRPLLNVNDPLSKITELLEKRKPFYERADYHIRTSGMAVEEVVRAIERMLENAEYK